MSLQINQECPNCHEQTLFTRTWYEDYWIVEKLSECKECGYLYHWSYGSVIESREGEASDG